MISSLFRSTVPRVVLFSLICITTSLQAVFYQVELFRSPEGKICCLVKDEHCRCNNDDFAQKQLDNFANIVKKYKNKTTVIIEAKGKYCPIISRQKINQEAGKKNVNGFIASGLLCHLYDRLEEMKVALVNIDHRVLIDSFLETVLIKDILKNFYTALGMEKLYGNQDGSLLQALYGEMTKGMLGAYKNFIKELSENSQKTLQAVEASKSHKRDKEKFREDCYSFDSNLIDMHILHNMYQHRDKKLLFVCAGGYHIDGVMRCLRELKYIHVSTIGNDPEYDDEFDVVDDQIIDVASIFDTQLLSKALEELFLPDAQPKAKAGSKRSKGTMLVNPQSPKKVKTEQSASQTPAVKQENQETQNKNNAGQQAQPSSALPLQDSLRLLIETETLFNAGMLSFRQQATMPGFQQPAQKL